ncbi:hypothetical protein [Armatimonas rosea]|uniref:Uncharacterized protein n=1 Tax=Armatimonas rosea TaxID=685828 RepID=A0A7W9STE9_ARMRO|nr:hypothetical protein [Armatimonas rosea]MBB6052060.1 hypothetical protein [Armatimonas rosea]
MWWTLDLLFPLCPWAWLAQRRARASLSPAYTATLTRTERFRWGWVFTYTLTHPEDGTFATPRVVLQGTGVVYRAVGGYPGRKGTERYFRRHQAALPANLWGGRRVWCLTIPCSRSECGTIARTLNDIFETPELPGEAENWPALPSPLFYGSRTAMQWLSDRLAEQGLPSRVQCVLRSQARKARLFRVTHFAMSLPDALRDNGDSWHGNAPFNRFEETR